MYKKYHSEVFHCPHCGKETRIHMEAMGSKKHDLITCGLEYGGCDKEYVIEVSNLVTVKVVYKLE